MILDHFKLTGKTALITGAGKGIGKGIALAFAETGANLVLAARTAQDLEETARAARALGVEALSVPTDVMDRTQLESLASQAFERFGTIDVLVNNAGGGPHQPVLRTSEKVFEQALRFNVTQAFLLTRLVAPRMLEAGSGSILNVSSSLGHVVGRGFVAYGTAKAALEHMTRLLASELAPKIRVNAVACGAIETDALRGFLSNEAVRAGLTQKTPMRGVGRVVDIAAAAVYLSSDAASYVTGKVLEVDGGIAVSNTPFDLPDL